MSLRNIPSGTFRGIRAGDSVTFKQYAGLDIVRGKAAPAYRPRSAPVCPLLIFADHVVVNVGKGRPQVVDADNYVSHRGARK